MKEEEGYFKSREGLNLFYRFYRSEGAQRTLMLLHGHGEHLGRYSKFASVLKEEKINIAIYDTRGSGCSEGLHVYVDSFEDFIADVSVFRSFLKEHYAVTGKMTLLGHSMGGLVALHWAMRNPDEIECLILSSPCLGLKLPMAALGLNALLNKIWPRFVYRNPVYPPYLTHNLAEVETYKKDPLIRRKISVRLLSEMIKYTAKLKEQDAFKFPFPVYILMAGQERVVDCAHTREIYEKIEAPIKQLKCFDGFYHEIFNELEQEKAFDALKACLHDSFEFAKKAGNGRNDFRR